MLGRLIAMAHLCVWALALYLVVVPRRDLGGLVGEPLRWLERLVLLCGLMVGFMLTGYFGEIARPEIARARTLRLLLYPPALFSASALITLTFVDREDLVGAVLTGFLAYGCGVCVRSAYSPDCPRSDADEGDS